MSRCPGSPGRQSHLSTLFEPEIRLAADHEILVGLFFRSVNLSSCRELLVVVMSSNSSNSSIPGEWGQEISLERGPYQFGQCTFELHDVESARTSAESVLESSLLPSFRHPSHPIMALVATWTKISPSISLHRSSLALSVIGDKAYIFGGEVVPRTPLDGHLYQLDLDGPYPCRPQLTRLN